MALPTLKSTAAGGKQFAGTTLGPAIQPLQGFASGMAHPLQTLNAPPIVTGAAAAIGTMFGAEKKDTTGGGGLQTAGKGLQGAGASLTQAGTSLNTAASTLNQDVVPDLLRDIRDSNFGMEKATEKTAEWLGKIFRHLGGTVKKGSAPQGQMGKIGGGHRKTREDKTADLEALEKEREEDREEGEDGDEAGAEAEAEAEKKSSILSGIFNKIPGFKMISGLLSGGAGLLKLFGKLFWPITVIMGVVSFVTGFMEGFEEDGLIGGLKSGFENLINNLIDVPLNMIKDFVSWIFGVFGFEETAAALDSFEFDFSGGFILLVEKIELWITDLWDSVKELWENITGFISKGWKKITGGFTSFFGGGDDDEPAPSATPATPEEEAAMLATLGVDPTGAPTAAPAPTKSTKGKGGAAASRSRAGSGGWRNRRRRGGGKSAAPAPTPTATASISVAPGAAATSDTPGAARTAGTGLGSTGDLLSAMAGDLGDAVLAGGFGVQKVSEHPAHGGYSAKHVSAAHREHRAIDIGTGASAGTRWIGGAEGRWDYESIQNPIRAYMERWAAARGAKLKVIGGDFPGPEGKRHEDHLHVEIASGPKAGGEVGGPGPGIRVPETGGIPSALNDSQLQSSSRGAAAAAPVVIGGGSSTNIISNSSTPSINAPPSPRGPGLPSLSSIEHHSGSVGYQPT